MRVGIFTDDYYARESGMITSIKLLKRGLELAGNEVYIIAPRPSKRAHFKPEKRVVLVRSTSSMIFKGILIAIPSKHDVQRIEDLELDVIHSMTQHNLGVLAHKLAKKLDIPHVSTFHTMFPELAQYFPRRIAVMNVYTRLLYTYGLKLDFRADQPTPLDFIWPTKDGKSRLIDSGWKIISAFSDVCDAVVVPSRHVGEELKFHRKNDTKVAVIPTGIDVDFFKKPRKRAFLTSGKLEVAVVGRVSDEKRTAKVIEAVAGTRNSRLHVVGDGEDRGYCESLAKSLRANDRIKFYGSKPQQFVRKVLLRADVLVLASHNFDTQGMVMLEAAAAGVPVVYCDPSLSACVAPGGSILSGPKSDNIRQVLQQIIGGKYDLEKMSKKSLAFAEKHTYDEFASKLLVLYKKVQS
jgi:1,2-diacylglycerol 3-alpha-glucosyltransferase